jgi:hypothetical protein
MNIVKNQVYTYHSGISCLNGVKYRVIRTGAKKTTLSPVHGQSQLIGMPTFREPFQIATADFIAGIAESIYTLCENN